ncbi:L,D-transpeptidase family protein [Asticcacaulis sp. BYS171W]|uniref:L,D-transpeptidase family protein n=1 Tax=Asticcacaulis aquaticus TaxID=2984212 RepID=A0ABT5HSK7_9CAUL|nr:L,D-transpeptidase family protein [Asticcacaulis aquaticus]MDC7683039.1 L,D-transpeptidase family protein [Asticcacaulis aquaticus]
MVKIFTAYAEGFLVLNSDKVRCALGKGGVIPAADKREGDLRSPLGMWPLKYVFYRPDRLPVPETVLPVKALSPDDGWCDDAGSESYNQHVKLPFDGSHEKLWREDGVYDIVCVLGHNDDPPVKGLGSAIFLHLAREDYSGTEGCVALSQAHLLELLKSADAETYVEIVRD